MEEHDAALIRNGNETVGSHDEVWHFGDVMSAKAGSCNKLLRKLIGRKHLIVGNNDPATTTRSREWDSVTLRRAPAARSPPDPLPLCVPDMEPDGKDVYSSARPLTWAVEAPSPPFDAGVDAQGLRPVTLDVILRRKPVADEE